MGVVRVLAPRETAVTRVRAMGPSALSGHDAGERVGPWWVNTNLITANCFLHKYIFMDNKTTPYNCNNCPTKPSSCEHCMFSNEVLPILYTSTTLAQLGTTTSRLCLFTRLQITTILDMENYLGNGLNICQYGFDNLENILMCLMRCFFLVYQSILWMWPCLSSNAN